MSKSAPAAEPALRKARPLKAPEGASSEDARAAAPLGADEAAARLHLLLAYPRVLLAVSGGPDSTALLHLAAAWRAERRDGPELFCASVDHALRPQSAQEAQAVARLCAARGIPHRILAWEGDKPRTGIQDAARNARYRLLAAHATEIGAAALILAHTLDDQAETLLFRLARGSGLSGLCGMRPLSARGPLTLVRPFLDLPKARLIATLEAEDVPYVRDPSNADPRFARPRWRALAPQLAAEGLNSARLGQLALRLARADAALEASTDAAEAGALLRSETEMALPRDAFAALPQEIAVRLLGRAIDRLGHEGPVELAKLEALEEALRAALACEGKRFRRTLAGAMVTLSVTELKVEPAPERRKNARRASNPGAEGSPRLGKEGGGS